jgi:hypothetical protein
MDAEKKEFGKWWIWILALLIVSVIVFGILSFAGVIGERIVFENSYQYKAARAGEVAVFEAQLVEIDHKLAGALDADTKAALEAQAAAIRINLNSARRQK